MGWGLSLCISIEDERDFGLIVTAPVTAALPSPCAAQAWTSPSLRALNRLRHSCIFFHPVYFSLFPCDLCKKCDLKNLAQVKLPPLSSGCSARAFFHLLVGLCSFDTHTGQSEESRSQGAWLITASPCLLPLHMVSPSPLVLTPLSANTNRSDCNQGAR